ncbi:hypothetical protein HDU98_007952 [Podochytrium sp. JEL0797]|nr:hypothetical protein HDU98_007952 [Podochytrium sp. JEL0797]
MLPNTKILFKTVPIGPATLDTFEIDRAESIDPLTAEIELNTVLVKVGVSWLSLDPYMRGKMRAPETKWYSPAYAIGEPLSGHGVGIVCKSNSPKFNVGDAVSGILPWCSFANLPDTVVKAILTTPKLPHEAYLGILGMPSFTAYVGLIAIGKPKAGETLFVSAAAGAVGQVVGQIGKRLGLHVVGSAGSNEKVSLLTTKLGFDAAFNYNNHVTKDKLNELCPNGIDIYFDNVGGETLDAVLPLMNNHGRIPVCGMISQYNGAKGGDGIQNLLHVVNKRLLIQGFSHSAFLESHHDAFLKWMGEHALDESFVYEATVAEGIESIPEAFVGMMEGRNIGKQLVKL